MSEAEHGHKGELVYNLRECCPSSPPSDTSPCSRGCSESLCIVRGEYHEGKRMETTSDVTYQAQFFCELMNAIDSNICSGEALEMTLQEMFAVHFTVYVAYIWRKLKYLARFVRNEGV